MTRVRIRGIYATALTEALRNVVDVVGVSRPIERRFEDAFPDVGHDVAIRTTGDRIGVGLVGDPAGVESVRGRIEGIGRDALGWEDPAPRGAIFDATVTKELGRGAVVDLGPREGFLPYDAVDDYVGESDELRVQVHEAAPPWSERRPSVGTRLRAFAGLVDLVRGGDGPRADVHDEERASELVRTTAMLPTELPDGWAVRWNPDAADAGFDALDDALAVAAERAASIAASDDTGSPEATAWIRFGRETRFALDGRRREVTATMPGHHRIKAATSEASTAVDFAEGLCEPGGEFPFDLVADQFGPDEGDELRIQHGKPDGRVLSLGSGEVTGRDGETLTLRREMSPGGDYDALGVPREAGDVAITKLKEGRWWYPTVYRDADGESKGTYVNVCTPVELFPSAATYVDLEVDVVRHADGSVERVDDDELDAVVDAGHVPDSLAEKARGVAAAVERALS